MWSLPPGDTVLHLLTYVALAAQAMTAALAAGRRSMDWAGVCMLGCITALGGGTIRDVLLGHYPLVWVQNPLYLGLTAVAAFVTAPFPYWTEEVLRQLARIEQLSAPFIPANGHALLTVDRRASQSGPVFWRRCENGGSAEPHGRDYRKCLA